jgi:DNA-binding IclR family transcriptional regulator
MPKQIAKNVPSRARPDGVPQRSSRATLRHDGTHWFLDAQFDEAGQKVPPGVVPALENAIAIVAYLNSKGSRPANLAEITSSLGISKSHCHSLLKTLVYFDWVAFDADTKVYRLQSGILSDTSSLLNQPILGAIRPLLAALVERVKIPCVVSEPLLDGSFVVVERFNARHIMEVSFPIGHRFPRDACAQMRAHLAWQSTEQIDAWMQHWSPVRYTESTLLDAASIRAEIGATRRRGYSRSVGEFTDGLMAMGLPIFDRSGRVVYIFHCSSLVSILLPREEEVARDMQRTAGEIHRTIVARAPPDFPDGLRGVIDGLTGTSLASDIAPFRLARRNLHPER